MVQHIHCLHDYIVKFLLLPVKIDFYGIKLNNTNNYKIESVVTKCNKGRLNIDKYIIKKLITLRIVGKF